MRFCNSCKLEKPLDKFSFRNKKKKLLAYTCKECHNEACRRHYLKNKEYYLVKARKAKRVLLERWKSYKSDKFCLECGENHPAVLDFHHPNPNKEFDISKMVALGKSWKAILIEAAKCVVLCSNCHRKLHYELRIAR